MQTRDMIEELTAKGRYTFTAEEAREALGVSPAAARQSMYRAVKRGWAAMPMRGFYVTLPPAYRVIGCLPADQFIPQLMALRGERYYAGLLTAAQYHGAAHQKPMEFQVFLQHSQRPILCGRVRIRFIARKHLEHVPVQMRTTRRNQQLVMSTPEATALDLIGYEHRAAGISHVATVLAELAEVIDPAKLARVAEAEPITWVQRLGYILEFLGAFEAASGIRELVQARARDYTVLAPRSPLRPTHRRPDWKLIINSELDPDVYYDPD